MSVSVVMCLIFQSASLLVWTGFDSFSFLLFLWYCKHVLRTCTCNWERGATQENDGGREQRRRVNNNAVRRVEGEQIDAVSILPSELKGMALLLHVHPIKSAC